VYQAERRAGDPALSCVGDHLQHREVIGASNDRSERSGLPSVRDAERWNKPVPRLLPIGDKRMHGRSLNMALSGDVK
jgi:hypothetical protein